MPTYMNSSNQTVTVKEMGLKLPPGRTASIVVIPERWLLGKYANLGITRVDIFPCYNPIVAEHIVQFTALNDYKTITLNVMETDYIEIAESSTNCIVFIQDMNNEPAIRLKCKETVRVRTRHRVEKVIFDPDGEGALFVREMTDEVKYDRWDRTRYSLESIPDVYP